MKKILLFGLIGLMIFSAGYSTLDDDLISYYNFEETSGTTFYDSLFLYNGTNSGETIMSSGINGYGYELHSSSGKKLLIINPDIQDLTWNIWYKINDTVQTGLSSFFYKGDSDPNATRMATNTDSGGIWFPIVDNDFYYSTQPFHSNEWQMITITRNTTHTRIFINGIWDNTLPESHFGGNTRFGGNPTNDRWIDGWVDEVAVFSTELTTENITYLYNNGDGRFYPFTDPIIMNYNVTQIFDNSTLHNVEFNTTQAIEFTGYNDTGLLTPQLLNINIPNMSYDANQTSGIAFNMNFNNASANIYEVIVTNPYNSSVSETFYFTINDVKNISYINTSTFFKYNITQSLNFTNNLDTGIYTCDDYYNLTIPSLNISNRLIKSCELTSVTFNNSLIYNYTTYLTNERFSRIINNTVYFYTNAYNNTIPNYNQTIVNNTITDIKWYLNTFPNYASSNQNINVTIDFNGTTTTPTASALNYTYFNLLTSDELVETVPFYLILNLTYGTESLLFNESYTQSITTLQLDNCSTYSNTLMWLHIKDELDLNRVDLVPNSSVYMSFNVNGGYFTLNVINDTDGVIQVCTNNSVNFTADVDFSYIAENFGASTKPNREHFFFKTYFNNIINQSFYKLPTANAEKIIFNLVDNAQQPLVNYYLNIKKWYGDGYSTVAIAKTDINGQAITYVEYNIPNYAFDILNENGTLVDSTENIILTTTPTTIQVDEGTGVSSYFVDNNSYGYINVWNNGTEYFTTIMNNENSVDTTFKLLVYYSNGSILCSETSTQTTSYTTMCEVPDWSNQTFIVRGSLIRNNDNRFILLYNYLIDDRLPTTPIFDTDEGLLWLAIMIIVSSVGIVAISPSFLPLSPAISLLLTNALGLTSISVFMIGGLTVTGIILMLWFMKT